MRRSPSYYEDEGGHHVERLSREREMRDAYNALPASKGNAKGISTLWADYVMFERLLHMTYTPLTLAVGWCIATSCGSIVQSR